MGDDSVRFGPEVTHTYVVSGTYTVTLTVSDPYGLSDTHSITVPIAPNRLADHAAALMFRSGAIPSAAFSRAKDLLHIGYGHTSHGSQLTTGMDGLVEFANNGHIRADYPPDLFAWSHGGGAGVLHLFEGSGTVSGELEGDIGAADFAAETRAYLDNPSNAQCNVIMWAWCGDLAWMTASQLQAEYLTPMTALEADYPDVTFVYMTAHLEPLSADNDKTATVNARNNEIRAFCAASQRWLYDFAAIESRNPDGLDVLSLGASDECFYDSDGDGITDLIGDGGYADTDLDGFPDTWISGDRNWAIDWQNGHPRDASWYGTPADHTQPVNINMKAFAAWWLFAQIAATLE